MIKFTVIFIRCDIAFADRPDLSALAHRSAAAALRVTGFFIYVIRQSRNSAVHLHIVIPGKFRELVRIDRCNVSRRSPAVLRRSRPFIIRRIRSPILAFRAVSACQGLPELHDPRRVRNPEEKTSDQKQQNQGSRQPAPGPALFFLILIQMIRFPAVFHLAVSCQKHFSRKLYMNRFKSYFYVQ